MDHSIPSKASSRLPPIEHDILALPEIEREAILAERAADELKRQQDLQLKKALAATQAAASKHKRKAAAADLDDGGPRKNSRAKLEKTGRSALDDYKKAREAKGAERTGRFDTKRTGRRDSRSPSSVSDRDADGESEVEWADTTTSTRRDEPPAEMRDFERCRVGRSNFAKVLFYPNFEDTMKGCFCRVSIGLNRETGQNLYRMAQIKSFTHGKPYPLEAPNGKTFTCDIYALVAHGTAEKPWPCSACSDSRFSPEEYQRYIETLQKERLRVPKKGWLEQKLDDIHRFLNPQWDEAQLQGKFTRQREMEKRVDPANAAKAKKDAILKRQAEAEESGDLEEISRCEAELVALDVNASNGTTTTKPTLLKGSPSKPQVQTTQDKLALLNQKNRDKNAADVRKALIADRKKLQAERERAIASAKVAAKAKAEAEAARREAEENGGLLGVPGREAMKEMFGDLSDVSRAGTPMSGVSTPRIRGRSRAGTPMNGVGVGKSKLGLAAKKKDEEDELGGLDLGIDVEI